ncbi:MAG: L-aspartate oxidase [Candidatus Acidoferrales bacterium]
MKSPRTREADYLVIGCGVAGLRAAIELAGAGKVLVLSKAELTESATQYAQGGIAAALSDEDEIALHYQDTLQAGDSLCHEAAVKILVEEGPARIQELIKWGTAFDRKETKLAFTREGAHSRSRVLHAHGDSTGREITRALFARARASSIEFLPYMFTTELLLEKDRVVGARLLDEQQKTISEIRARALLLATGGLGQVYAETTNPSLATGDGVAIAYRAGAVLRDIEFVQFHPTALYCRGAPRFLLSEALRGEGGCLRNVDLERFMPRYHEAADLAPRDVVSRALMMELRKTGAEFVYLDLTGLDPEHVRARFPRIYATCQEYNLDITADLLPVRPAAHYAMGGIATDLDGRTTLAGLFAAGEVACNGVHGANRLASNSLLEGLVYGARAGRAMAPSQAAAKVSGRVEKNQVGKSSSRVAANPGPSASNHPLPADGARRVAQIREVMWQKVGIIRSAESLQAALEILARLAPPLPSSPGRTHYEQSNLHIVAEVIARCALAREESRGAHYRSDFPCRDDERWGRYSRIALGQPVTFE